MVIQATPYGTKKEEPFAFTYSGDFTDERVDGIGDVTLNTSGQLVTTGKTVRVTVYILGAGGGGAQAGTARGGSGGGGGKQTITVELTPGTYDIVIGTGGTGYYNATASSFVDLTGGAGGNTSAFGATSTGGSGGHTSRNNNTAGAGGTPNGNSGESGLTSGGAPNGGASNGGSAAANNGGDGLVRITFS